MADDSTKAPKAVTLSESDREAFYAWTTQQGFTRLDSKYTDIIGEIRDIVGEMWIDHQGEIWSAGRIVRRHPDWRSSASKGLAAPEGSFSTSLHRIQWLRLLPTTVLVTILIGALQLVRDSRHTVAAATDTTDTAGAPAISSDEMRLGLQVTSDANLFEIRWNGQSATIAASDRGEMKITAEGITESVPLGKAELGEGYVAYGPKTKDVSIRLEVVGKDGVTTSESVRAITIP